MLWSLYNINTLFCATHRILIYLETELTYFQSNDSCSTSGAPRGASIEQDPEKSRSVRFYSSQRHLGVQRAIKRNPAMERDKVINIANAHKL